jgi:nicotinamidase-related amidase
MSGEAAGAAGPGREPYLAVIDMQRVFGEPDSPWLAPRFAEIIEPISRLAGVFRPRVVFTRFVAPAVPHGAWQEYYAQWPFALQPPGSRMYDLADEFAAAAGTTLDATTFSQWGPKLASLAAGGPLVLAGVSTDCCVLSTALAAADEGVPVRVIADACAGIDDESHAKALDILRLYSPLVEVVTVADVLGHAPAAASRAAPQPTAAPAEYPPAGSQPAAPAASEPSANPAVSVADPSAAPSTDPSAAR